MKDNDKNKLKNNVEVKKLISEIVKNCPYRESLIYSIFVKSQIQLKEKNLPTKESNIKLRKD